MTADDNFYISRVKPRARFRNEATQVRLDLNAKNDKKLIAWIPVNNPDFNALPNGVFDQEVFSMWSYVTHWGDWTTPLGRIPAAFLDIAHKNGVGVSGVASIPNATLSASWAACLKGIGSMDVDKASKFLQYYGIDGLGYNSEFYGGGAYVKGVRNFHAALVKKMKPVNPVFENFWYDGTNDFGQVSFDGGLGNHNKETFGDKDNVRTSLFFNYNWNRGQIPSSVAFAEKLGRDPLDIYCGVNMQGGEPGGISWSLLPNQRVLSVFGVLTHTTCSGRAVQSSVRLTRRSSSLTSVVQSATSVVATATRLSLRLLLTSISTQHTTRLGTVWLHS